VARLGRIRPGPVGIAITLFDVWRRLPPKQRKQVLSLALIHGRGQPRSCSRSSTRRARR
jgi:hypothetical protein